MIRLTLRMPKNVAQFLQRFKYLYQLRGQKISYNQLINYMILSSPNLRISKNDIEKIKHLHTSHNYLIFTKCLVYCTNHLNSVRHQIKPIGANINQIAKVINTYKDTLYGGSFDRFNFNLKLYQIEIDKMLKLLNQIDKKLVKFWKM